MKNLLLKFFVGGLVIAAIFGMQFSNFSEPESVYAKDILAAGTGTATIAPPVAPPAAPITTTHTPTPTKPVAVVCNTDDTACLEGVYHGLTILIKEQAKRLETLYKDAREAQSLVDKLNDEGKDTSALREALDNFTYQVNDAQQSHDQAKEIIDEHVGFDHKGKVTNRDQAKVTVQTAKDIWLYASQTLTKANKELRVAVAKAKRKPAPTKAPVVVDGQK